MHDREFERYLSLLSGMLRLSRGQRESIAQELRDHLEERLAELREAGVGEEEAVASALEEFGDIASLAREFTGVAGTLRRRTIMRFTVGTLGAAGVAAMFLLSFWPTAPMVREAGAQAPPVAVAAAPADAPSIVDAEDAKAAEVYRQLAKPIEFAATEQPLSKALAAIFQKCSVTWEFNKRSLEIEGVDSETPITVNLSKVSGQTALKLILDPLGLTFLVDDGVLEILSKTNAEERIFNRVYAVGDLTNREVVRGGLHQGVNGGFFGNANSPVSLIDVLTHVVEPLSWDDSGGRGSVREFRGMLVVAQTDSVHRQVGPLIENLRRVSQQPATRDTPAWGAVGQALTKKVDWKIAEMPLTELVTMLRKELGVDVAIDEKALEAGEVDGESKVSLTPGQFTARKALKMILDPLGLTWVNVRGEVLQLTTKAEAETVLEVRLYNVRDLLTPVGAPEVLDESEYDYDAVVELISSTVSPNTWAETGGSASIAGFRGMLVISQSDPEHERIAELLSRLRRARERQKGHVVAPPNPDELHLKVYRLENSYLFVQPSAVVEGEEGAEPPEPKPAVVRDARESAKEWLAIVQQLVEPKSWQSAGGKGQIFLLPDAEGVSLVVKQTTAVHKEVRALIRTIEREVQKQSSPFAGAVEN